MWLATSYQCYLSSPGCRGTVLAPALCLGGYACLRVLPIQTGEDPLPHPTAGLPPVEPRP